MSNHLSNEDMSNIISNLNKIFDEKSLPDNIKSILNSNNTKNISDSTSENIKQKISENIKDNSTSSNSSINPEMLNNLVNLLSKSSTNSQADDSKSENIDSQNTKSDKSDDSNYFDIDMILKMKKIIDQMNSSKDDPRSNLLKSLKPYLKNSRKEKVDQYIKIFNMSKAMELFNSSGGDNKK